ncbi:MAG TPA: hypothetical protein VKT53_12960 [Candidatus Acidoferrum sp.]|nr:hypothetical protein [Candidatus Acidoferrum sp.]
MKFEPVTVSTKAELPAVVEPGLREAIDGTALPPLPVLLVPPPHATS